MPALRKAVITFEEEEGAPQFTAIFAHWDMATELPEYIFNHEPSIGAVEIEFEVVKESTPATPAAK